MIMVLHGGPGSDYRGLLPLADLVNDGFYVVFWDQRGAGLSERHDASAYSLDSYLEDLRLVIEHYSADAEQPIVFIGHSWGAMYATWFINEYGDYDGRVRGAILSEPGAFNKAQLDRYMDDLMGSLDFFGEDVNDVTWMFQFMTPADHARADYMAMMMTDGGIPSEHLDPDNPSPNWRAGAVVNRKLISIVEDHGFDWTTNLDAFTSPVLFLRGELNEAMPLEHQQELASSYPDATVVTIPDVGHEMIWERPVEYLAEARAYLASLDL
jgi:proline iminopeptidase